ncbi:MAG: hypothetical protein LUP99_05890 [Methanomicrobiales archaeon]|nr:hypothetical protein [Methanomicrobiales archaeon]
MNTKDEIAKPLTLVMFSTDLMKEAQGTRRILDILKDAPECQEEDEQIARLLEKQKEFGKKLGDAEILFSEIYQKMSSILAAHDLYDTDPVLRQELMDAMRCTPTGWPWLYFRQRPKCRV